MVANAVYSSGRLDVLGLVNRYSFIALVLGLLLASAAAAYYWLPLPGGWLLVPAVGISLASLHFVLRYQAGQRADEGDMAALVGKGRPALVLVYSNY